MGVARILVITLLMTTGCRQILGFESASSPNDAAGDPDGPPLVEDTLIPDMTSEGWTKRKPIRIDGDQAAGNLTNFPLLVRIPSDLDLATLARDDGFDLLFMASDGTTKLAHEIEQFDGETGALVAWVRVPALADNNDTTLFLYFDNPLAPDQQDPQAVWDSNYRGVWHLAETSGTTASDSTIKDRDGTKTSATTPAPTAGVVAGGQAFGGTADGIAIGNANDLDIPSLTFETWLRVDACGGDVYRRIIDFTVAFASSWAVAYPCTGAPTVNQKSVVIDLPNGDKVQTPTNSLTSDVFHHLVFQTNPTEVWIDGVKRNVSPAPFGLAQDNILTVIGNRQGSVDRALLGVMDEVRISGVRRSQAYIETSHANQRPGSTMVTIGATETVAPAQP